MSFFNREHPLRDSLDKEMRARPFVPVLQPDRVSHLAMLSGEQAAEIDWQHVQKLCLKFDKPGPQKGATHFVGDMGPFRIRWERHTEFSTYTFFRSEVPHHPFDKAVITLVPEEWLAQLPGELLTAVHIELQKIEYTEIELNHLFKGNSLIGCQVANGKANFWTDLTVHDDRFLRILIQDVDLTDASAGRLIQRLLEIETYRNLALLSLPKARAASPIIRRVDDELEILADIMANNTSEKSDAELLGDLSRLSAEIESISATTSYRFGASAAYYDIVKQRLEEIRQIKIQGLTTLSGFIKRRLTPAMKTCFHTANRQKDLSERVSRAAGLLRVKVEVELERQNQSILETMNKRVGLQLRLQSAVEGLSVVAISYYLVGLLSSSLKGAKEAGLIAHPEIISGAAVPFVVIFMWLILKKARQVFEKE